MADKKGGNSSLPTSGDDDESGKPPAAPAIINKSMIVWGADGLPMATGVPTITKAGLEELAVASLSLTYDDPLGIYPEFKGMSNAEVMMVRMARKAADGDISVAAMLLDRVLGKPKQSVESKNVSFSYEDYLKALADKVPPRDVTPRPGRTPDTPDNLGGLV